jgi:AcrR family transcriptional regulator
MNAKGKSLENSTRQANKILRRNRILNIAKHLIASEGLEAFTLSQLADKVGVSVPTIHNLFGKKSDIYQELIAELVIALQGVMSKPMFGDPVESAKFFAQSIVSMYTDNEDFYRAAYMAGNQEGIFDDRKSKDGFVYIQCLNAVTIPIKT